VIVRQARSYAPEEMIFNPLHHLGLLETLSVEEVRAAVRQALHFPGAVDVVKFKRTIMQTLLPQAISRICGATPYEERGVAPYF
jgi:hypothetical protein